MKILEIALKIILNISLNQTNEKLPFGHYQASEAFETRTLSGACHSLHGRKSYWTIVEVRLFAASSYQAGCKIRKDSRALKGLIMPLRAL